MTIFFLIMKIAGAILSGLFGVIGTIHDFRNHDGRITKWGKFACIGLFVSVVCTISVQVWETYDQKIKSAESIASSRALRQSIDGVRNQTERSIRPIESVGIYVKELDIPNDDPLVAFYTKQLSEKMDALPRLIYSRDLTEDESRLLELMDISLYSRMFVNGEFESISLYIGNSMNNFEPRGVLRHALRISGVRLRFYKDKPEIEAHGIISEPSLAIDIVDNLDLHNRNFEPRYIAKNTDGKLQNGSISVSGELLSDDKSEWVNNGQLVSEPDLKGAWLAFDFMPLSFTLENEYTFRRIRSELDVISMELLINGRIIHVGRDALIKHVREDGNPFWIFQFNYENPFVDRTNSGVPKVRPVF